MWFSTDPLPEVVREEINELAAEFENLREEDADRLKRYEDYRNETEAARQADLGRVQGGDYGRASKHRNSDDPAAAHEIKLPFGQALTVKHTYRIAGRMPEFIIPRREETPQERYRADTMSKIVWSILERSNGDQQIGDGAWDSSRLGAACYDLYLDAELGMPRLRAIDPAGVLVIPGVEDPHDFERAYRFWHVPVRSLKAKYKGVEFSGGIGVPVDAIGVSHKRGNVEMATVVQVSDRHRRIRFVLEGKVPLLEEQHNHGFVPYVVIPNLGPERDVWGWADYEFGRSITAYFAALFGREADILRNVANGALYAHGTGLPAETIKQIVRQGGVVQGKKEGKVEPIQTPDVPNFAANHTEIALRLIKMLTFSPDAAWGDGAAGSGSDRSLQLQPQLELTGLKQINWSGGLRRIVERAFKMVEQYPLGPVTYRGARPNPLGQMRGFSPFKLGHDLSRINHELESGEIIEIPRDPRELFDGDYAVRVLWANRIDPDDPAYAMSEVNKFRQGVQSLRTTLENLGVNDVDAEMRLIEQEADRFPWLNAGLIALTRAQLSAQGAGQGAGGGGAASMPFPDTGGAMGTMTGESDGRALDFDALSGALAQGAGSGTPYGGA